jgi:uncharacterized integral membrane protein (TIGR00698 family)
VKYLSWARRLGPGLFTAVLIALAATFVSEHYGGPQFLYALLFGISLNFLSVDPKTRLGIEFAARTVLRIGVALLGARITLQHLAALGPASGLLVVAAVFATVGFGVCVGWLLKRPTAEGLLTGGAVGICGASAALAISAILPRQERSSQFTLLTVVGVTALSTIAMIVYPALVSLLGFNAGDAGVFLGGTIHDVAQVVGAGYMISQEAGDNATIVKLLRVAMLVPVVLVLSFIYRARDQARPATRLLPWFLAIFVLLILVNSAGWISKSVEQFLSATSRWCLVSAIAALGVKTSFRELAALGWRPVALLISETLFLAGLILSGLIALHQ